jgi:hypothetical protein
VLKALLLRLSTSYSLLDCMPSTASALVLTPSSLSSPLSTLAWVTNKPSLPALLSSPSILLLSPPTLLPALL